MVEITAGVILVLLLNSLVSGVVLYLSIRLVGGKHNFKKSVLLALIMNTLVMLLPTYLAGVEMFSAMPTIAFLLIYVFIWFVLVTSFFKISFGKAIIVAIVQVVVAFVLALVSILAIFGAIIGIVSLA